MTPMLNDDILATPNLTRLTRCLEPTGEANASSAPPMDTPYAVHFACNSKPWLPHNQGLFFARAWLRHLAAVNARIAAASGEAEEAFDVIIRVPAASGRTHSGAPCFTHPPPGSFFGPEVVRHTTRRHGSRQATRRVS